MNISEELLARYLKCECTPEENLSVSNYLKKLNELPENLLLKDDWDDAEDAIISDVKSEEMFAEIKRQTISRSLKLKRLKIIAAAAIVLVIFTVGLLLLNKTEPSFTTAKTKIPNKEKKAEIVWKSFVNYTDNIQMLELPDNSMVKVYPGGELRYAVPFIKQTREIYLKGKGFFQVAKDKKHPFIVYAKGISTTALGTSFTITTKEKNNLIKVELHTGKVWIKNVPSSEDMLSFNRILLPGNELIYNTIKHQVNITDKNLINKDLSNSKELSFTQASLIEVFEKLKQHYKIKITYDEDDLNEISFTGTINLNQNVEAILKEITELNKLNQTKTTAGYIISK